MPRRSPREVADWIHHVISMWASLRSTKSFLGLTVDQFKQAVQPSFDRRVELTQIDSRREAVVVLRDQADDASLALIKRLVNAIRADADEGEDGEFYSTLGYVRTSKRSSGLVRRQTREEPKSDQVPAPSQAEFLPHSPALPYRSS